MAIFVEWLADAARMTGYPVVEVAGWQSRGASGGDGFSVVEGVTGHHTAGPATGEYPSFNVVLNGRPGLTGPLANYGIGRSGTIYVFGAGKANHAGVSEWAGFSNLNNKFIGIEAEDNGDGTWTPEQLDVYPRLVAAILHYMNRGADRYAAHRDVALPRGRKPDPTGISSDWMRDIVGHYLANPASITKNGAVPLPAPILNAPVRPATGGLLRVGSRGNTVKHVQNRLNVHGFKTGVDGIFGPNTKASVMKFQQAVRIGVDGIVGPQTLGKLNEEPHRPPTPSVPAFPGTVRRGDRGNAVRAVQQRLRDRGWRIDVDGIFGPGTERIVRAFQAEKGLAADGIAGPQTWNKLWTAPL